MKTARNRVAVGLAIISLALLGGWTGTRSYAAGDPAPAKQTADDELQRLLRARLDSAGKGLQIERDKLNRGTTTCATVCQTARHVLDAELELCATSEERTAALTKHIDLMREFERDAAMRIERGILPSGEVETPRYWRLTAEIELLRVKRAAAAK